ncbi:MAG: hypothetical protein COV30_00215 [Candidatus Yanofskybacteria bacterium CG10_big_fil_rev_8_21_14_0_10_37_15]|uniref:Uncharacterized protein n=1 Tax=Candidatus Yanofskybacteria bacterium CG10_big_fil_rev_8_21_14_0_10_37_15 TaxID=1975097 RepID=A0A2H0R6H4_9BACT|nr:MAG: hypothetical protein COV30_00215 [Candidatus Yanofskybacteria bacterium CG10_big_fil_rev_8_21_14_0_10_37_15]
MAQEFLLEVIKNIKTKKKKENKFRDRRKSNFFKLRRKTLKGIQKEIDLILKNYNDSGVISWRVYTSFPFE